MKKIQDALNDRSALVLTAIVLLGAAFRFYRIDFQSLWYDELHSIIPSDPANSLSSIVEYARNDQPPLLFIYLHYVFKVFGYSEYVGRMACAVAGVAGIVTVYFLGKEVSGKSAGLFAAFISSINYFHIYYSQELRFYSLCFLFSALSYLFLIKAFKTDKLVHYAWYVIFTSCLLYTHYYGMFVFASQVLTFLILLTYRRDRRFIMRALLAGLLIAASFIPWIPVVLHDMGISSFWIKSPDPGFLALYFYEYTGKEVITLLLFLFFLFLFVKTFRSREQEETSNKAVYWIIVAWLAFSYLIPYVRSITSTPILHERYTIVSLPAWFVLIAIGWDSIKKPKLKFLLAPLLLVAAVVNLAFFKQHYTRLQKDQFREASSLVLSRNQSHYPVFSGFAWQFNYFFRNSPDKVAPLPPGDLSGIDTFWLLQAQYSPEESEREINGLSKTFMVAEKYSFFGSNAVLFRKPGQTQ